MHHMNHFLPDLSRLALPTGCAAKRPRKDGDEGDSSGMEAESASVDAPCARWFPVIGRKPVFKLLDTSTGRLAEFDADPLEHRIWKRSFEDGASNMDKTLKYKTDRTKMLWTNAKLMFQHNIQLTGQKIGIMRFYLVEPSARNMTGVFEQSNSTGIFDDYTLARECFERGFTVDQVQTALTEKNRMRDSAQEQTSELIRTAGEFTRDLGASIALTDNSPEDPENFGETSPSFVFPITELNRTPVRRLELIQADRAMLNPWIGEELTVRRLDAYLTRAVDLSSNRRYGREVQRFGVNIADAERPGIAFMTIAQMIDLEGRRKTQMEKDIDEIVNFYGPDENPQSSMLLPRADESSSPQLLVGVLSTQQGGSVCGLCKRAIGVMRMNRGALDTPDGLHKNVEHLLNTCDWLQ